MNLIDLTPKLIDAMEAGPACNELVAQALGWRLMTDTGKPYWVDPSKWADGQLMVPEPLPPFSTSWDAVMGAAEKAWPDSWIVAKQVLDGSATYFADSFHGGCEASAPTGPLAICRAILKAAIQDKTHSS